MMLKSLVALAQKVLGSAGLNTCSLVLTASE